MTDACSDIEVLGKNPAAVKLGRLGGKKGGPARAEKLTPERRSEIAKLGAKKRWAKKKHNPCCDYAHYYLGCRYRFTFHDGDYIESRLEAILYDGALMGDNIGANKKDVIPGNLWLNSFEINDFRLDGNFQLFLTHPSDMTKQQKEEYKKLCYECRDNAGDLLRIVDTPDSLVYLFRNGIDVFSLIDNGHAIDLATNTKTH